MERYNCPYEDDVLPDPLAFCCGPHDDENDDVDIVHAGREVRDILSEWIHHYYHHGLDILSLSCVLLQCSSNLLFLGHIKKFVFRVDRPSQILLKVGNFISRRFRAF